MQLGVNLDSSSFPDTLTVPPFFYGSSVNIVPAFQGEGRLQRLEIDPELDKDKHLGGRAIYFKTNDIVKCAPAGNHYLGWIIALGSSREDAEAHLRRLLSMVKYEIVGL